MAEAGCILEAGEGGLRSSKPGDVLMAEYLMSHQVLFGIECWECWGSITEKRDMDVSTRISSWGSGRRELGTFEGRPVLISRKYVYR